MNYDTLVCTLGLTYTVQDSSISGADSSLLAWEIWLNISFLLDFNIVWFNFIGPTVDNGHCTLGPVTGSGGCAFNFLDNILKWEEKGRTTISNNRSITIRDVKSSTAHRSTDDFAKHHMPSI